MAVTGYQAVSWMPHEVISEEKSNVLASNVQWIHENTPRGMYTSPGISKKGGVKIACGRVPFDKSKEDTGEASVNLGQFFSAGCQPVVTTGIVTGGQRKVFAVVEGLTGLHPDNTGFLIRVEVAAPNPDYDSIRRRFWVTWMAMGY